jgi:hypothetical protein
VRALVPLVTILAAAGSARAAEIVVDVEGDCPDAAQVRAELPVNLPETARLRVEVERRGETLLRVRLVDGHGVAVVRELAGRDCTALAGVISVIVEGRLLELGELPPPPAPVVEAKAEPAPPPQEQAADDEDPLPPAPTGPRVPILVPTVVPAPPRPARLTFGLLGAMTYDTGERGSASAGAAQLDLGYRLSWYDLRARGQLTLGASHTPPHELMDFGTSRSAYGLRADLGPRLGGGRFWVQPAAGLALVTSRVTIDHPEPISTWRLHIAGSLAVDVGVRLGEGVSLRLGGGVLLFPFSDDYVVQGEIAGASPRTSLSMGLGLDVALGTKKD